MAGHLDFLKFLLLQIIFVRFSASQTYSGEVFSVFSFEGDHCFDSSGLSGICKPIEDCPYALELLRNGNRPTTCSFVGSNPIVCCPKSNFQIPPGSSRSPGEAAKYWCARYEELCPKFSPVIVGGVKALPAEFPHMAAIGYGPEEDINWSCGGSLISDRFVLTAAHCLRSGQTGPARWVLLGSELLRETVALSPYAKRGQTHPVVRKIPHPDYHPPSKYNDIALLEMGPATEHNVLSTLSQHVHPACLPVDDELYYASKGIATGWGRVGYGDDPSPDLLKVELDIIDKVTCNESYDLEIRTTKLLLQGIDNTMVCAGVLQGGKDTCQGDSGGPLQVVKRKECIYYILGVTSFGKICAYAHSPSVYTKVSEYIPWIESIVWPS